MEEQFIHYFKMTGLKNPDIQRQFPDYKAVIA